MRRIEYIDLAKGICICLVVLYHTKEIDYTSYTIYYESTLETWLTTFRMPLYFFLSGLFFKEYGGLKTFFYKKTNKLLVPFFSFFLIGCLPWKIYAGLKSTTTFFNYDEISDRFYFLYPTGAIWFLLCLFFANMIFFIILHYIKNTSSQIIAISILTAIGLTCSYYEIQIPLFIDPAFTCLPFFISGYFINHKTNLISNNYSKTNMLLLLITLAVVIFCFVYLFGIGKAIYPYNYFEMPILLMYFYAFTGIITVLTLSKLLVYIPIISYFGRYSIVILCTHQIIMRGIVKIPHFIQESPSAWNPIIVFVATLSISYPIIRIAIKYFPYIFAQKDIFKA